MTATIIRFPQPGVPQLRDDISDDILQATVALIRAIKFKGTHATVETYSMLMLDLIDEVIHEVVRCRGGNAEGGDVA
jgi:hypothetical protein